MKKNENAHHEWIWNWDDTKKTLKSLRLRIKFFFKRIKAQLYTKNLV